MIVQSTLKKSKAIWPIYEAAAEKPKDWPGWPDGKKFAFVITHDVELPLGVSRCLQLANVDAQFGFRSSFNFVPLRYSTPPSLRQDLEKMGFEVGVHDLYHDGKLYKSKPIFEKRAVLINKFLKEWGVPGFRSGAMHHNLEWISDLDIEYDASTFDTDPFEPMSDGLKTIFPKMIQYPGKRSYVELPYTLPQDFTLFVIMKEKTTDIWKRKLDWVVEKGGMALFIVHPDYVNFDKHTKNGINEYQCSLYSDFLEYVSTRYKDQYWNPLPKTLSAFYKNVYSETLECSTQLK